MQPHLSALGLVCVFLGWNMPNHYPPYPSFHGELMTGIGMVFIALGLAVAGRAQKNRQRLQPGADSYDFTIPRSAAVWALLALVPLLQFFFGGLTFRADLGFGMVYGLGVATAICLGNLWARRQGRDVVLAQFLGTIVAGAVVANGFGLAQWFRLPASGWWAMELIGDRPYGNLAQSNHFGLLMTMGTIAAAAMFEMRVIRSIPVFGLLAAFLGGGILMSQSRAAALAFLLAVVCWLLTRKRTPTRLRVAPVLAALAVWLVLLWQLDAIQEALLLNEHALRNRLEGGVRPAMWLHFWTAILAHPWLGYGFNQGVAALAEVATQLPPTATRSTVYAHNFVLDLAVWAGLPLAAIATGALALWLAGWLKKCGDVALQQHRHIVFALWLALVVQSLLEYPYAYAYFLLPAALLAGAITPIPIATGGRHAFGIVGSAKRWTCLLSGAASALLVVIAWDYIRLEEDFRHARFARANYVDRPHHAFVERPLLLDVLSTTNRTALRELEPGMSPSEIDEMRTVARRVQNPAVQVDYAKALALNGRMSEAQHELDILRSLYGAEPFAAMESEWRAWLTDNASRLPKR